MLIQSTHLGRLRGAGCQRRTQLLETELEVLKHVWKTLGHTQCAWTEAQPLPAIQPLCVKVLLTGLET